MSAATRLRIGKTETLFLVEAKPPLENPEVLHLPSQGVVADKCMLVKSEGSQLFTFRHDKFGWSAKDRETEFLCYIGARAQHIGAELDGEMRPVEPGMKTLFAEEELAGVAA